MSTVLAMEVPLLLLKNTVDVFLTAELWIKVFSKVLNTLRGTDKCPTSHALSAREHQQDWDDVKKILQLVEHSPTTSP
jgi:hypothetical protein